MSDVDKPKKTLSLKPKSAIPTSKDSKPAGTVVIRNGKRVIQAPNQRGAAVAPTHQSKPKPKGSKPKRPPRPAPKTVVPPSLIRARELSQKLAEQFSVWRDFKPLAIGIEQEVFKIFGETNTKGASKSVMNKMLSMHTRRSEYLKNLQAGGVRYHLDGCEAVDGITPYQVGLAGQWLEGKAL